MLFSWSGLVTAGLVTCASAVHSNLRLASSPSYGGRDICPLSCAESGPNPANWTAYGSGNLNQVQRCQKTVYYHFNIHGKVDDVETPQLLFACTADGSDAFPSLPSAQSTHKTLVTETTLDVTYAVTRWADAAASNATEYLRNSTDSVLEFLANGYGTTSGTRSSSPFIMFAQSPGATVGLYMGQAVSSVSTGTAALQHLQNLLDDGSASDYSGVSMQLCGSKFDAAHVVGYLATANRSFDAVQEALQTWNKGDCLPYAATDSFHATASFTSSLMSNGTNNSTSTHASHAARHVHSRRSLKHLVTRDDCTTITVVSGDSCGSLAEKCGISAADFTSYNSDPDLCSTLAVGQHVCCSAGTMPDFQPKPNANGTCYTYTVVADDSCSTIGATYDLTNDDIEGFNNNTWAWNGCSLLYVGANICLSSGDPPMPAALANAVCGPQKPNTTIPESGTYNLSSLNPCPLNACCDVWGQCGITAEFCTDTNTGAPGTAEPGTNGCISNCGTDIVQGDAPSQFIKLQYYEAFGMDRDCLFQDVSQLDLSDTTHIHFSFASMDTDYTISVGTSEYDKYEFKIFSELGDSVHKVLTIGGWAFSTDPSTYQIFRDGVKAENREAMATSIVGYVTDYELDGIDIDWEYPGEPDIPGIPAGSDDDGDNYLEFLKVLKDMMPSGTTVSIAAPASYWYLKAFPIKEIAEVVDYIVYMTYDLHGQWDYGSNWAQEGCADGNCLRSHVNLTETMTSLAMVTKAGVPSSKVIVGVSSYGRSFAMSTAGCYGPECTFTGSATVSDATAGVCTNTSGYISDAELYDILDGTDGQHLRRDANGRRHIDRSRRRSVSSRVSQYFVDQDSDSIIMVYDDTQWVAFMDSDIKTARSSKYAGLNLGGTTNWASDLETFNAAPDNYANWAAFKEAIKDGEFAGAGSDSMNRTGNWTELDCTTPAVSDADSITALDRWLDLGCPTALEEAIQAWNAQVSANPNNANNHFTSTVADFFHLAESTNCGEMTATGYCTSPITCQEISGVNSSGPAAYEIWNSFVFLHNLYYAYYSTIEDMAAVDIGLHQDEFMDVFAPIPPDKTQETIDLILAFVGLAGTVGVSALFNTVLKSLPYFTTNFGKIAYDNYKDIAKALVSFGVSVGGTYIQANPGKWTTESQDSFKGYMGDTLAAWQDSTAQTLQVLFNGESDSLNLLQSVVASGHFIASGDPDTHILSNPSYTVDDDNISYMRKNVTRSYYAYMIPSVWSAVGNNVFVLDTEQGCDADLSDAHLPDDASTYCYENTLYAVVYPDGDAQSCTSGGKDGASCTTHTFSNPSGIDALDGTQWGGVTVEDLVVGSVRTYKQNNNQNGGSTADPSDPGSLEDLMNGDITTPGYIIIPVCSSDYAWANWKSHGAKPSGVTNWPCGVYPSPNDCESSSFIDQTSDASPSVDDCMGIVNNIRGTQGEWTIQTIGEAQHKIASYGDCKFGVQATDLHGNVDFKVGAQDIVDIITQSVSLYGGGGKIGAKGYMDCSGNINSQDMEWGIY